MDNCYHHGNLIHGALIPVVELYTGDGRNEEGAV